MTYRANIPLQIYWNWYIIDACFFFQFWQITSDGLFAGLCIGLVSLIVFLEFLRRLQRRLPRSSRTTIDLGHELKATSGNDWEEPRRYENRSGHAAERHSQQRQEGYIGQDHGLQHGHHPNSLRRIETKEGVPHTRTGSPKERFCLTSIEEMTSDAVDILAMVPPLTPLLTTPSPSGLSRLNSYLDRIRVKMAKRPGRHFVSTAIYVRVRIAYLLILMAIYYNGHVIICMVIGAFLGHLIWGWNLMDNDDDKRHVLSFLFLTPFRSTLIKHGRRSILVC